MTNKKIREKIRKLKNELEQLHNKKNSFLHPEVINKSQKLDSLLNKYYKFNHKNEK